MESNPKGPMLACLLERPNRVSIREVQVPELSNGDVLVKMEACGICGTDLEKIDGRLGPGGILGHEISGTVQQTTRSEAVYHRGDRIVAHHHVPCYRCTYCLPGDFTMCDEFKTTNVDPCGLAENFRIPRYNVERGALLRLPEQLSFEEGAMIEPTACCIRAIRRAQPKRNDSVLVVGLGPTGLTHLQILRTITSGRIIGTDIIDSRLRLGAKLGADQTLNPQNENIPDTVRKVTQGGADLVLVATGNEKALDQAFSSVRKGGKVLLFGAPSVGARYGLDISAFFSRQASFVSSYSCVEPEMHEAIKMVAEKQINVETLITNRFTLGEAEKAFEHAATSRTSIKTIITS